MASDKPDLFLQGAATEKLPDQGLHEGGGSFFLLVPFPLLPGLPCLIQELGLGGLGRSEHVSDPGQTQGFRFQI